LLLYNGIFLKNIWDSGATIGNMLSIALIMIATIQLGAILLFSRPLHRFSLGLFSIGSGLSLYFMNKYNVMISKDILINLLETDLGEASNFFSIKMCLYIFMLIASPLYLFGRVLKIKFSSPLEELQYKLYVLLLFVCSMTLLFLDSNFYTLKKNRGFVDYFIPINYIRNLYRVATWEIDRRRPKKLMDISSGSSMDIVVKNGKKNLLVIVIGESVRAKNIGLSGYHRNTTEFLDKYERNSLYFKNVYSCGSSTFVSVPCMFSHLSKVEFSAQRANGSENLLDLYRKLGFFVLWESTNGSCKGVCDRVEHRILDGDDGLLVDNLAGNIKKIDKQNSIVVLHQRGNHGPLYSKRYPVEFEKFSPVCRKDLDGCDLEEIVNAYDNAIYYTSFLLARIIDILRGVEEEYNTALLYISDHGESLGEKNIFMHAGPYFLTKNEQWHVPMFLWFSDSFIAEFCLDLTELGKQLEDRLSHDNLFHSLLGLFKIQNPHYRRDLDIFHSQSTSTER
jgi:lipid A ethanolaminephosphotransferase